MANNREILLVKRPRKEPASDHLTITETDMPVPDEGEVLLRLLYVSVDPYMRCRMNEEASPMTPFELNQPLEGGAIAEVLESRSPKLNAGDIVTGNLLWREYSAADPGSLRRIDASLAPATTALHVLGLTGLTAYFGLMDIGKPQEGETVVISGAGGAVGSTAVQIATIAGARVVGIAGREDKVELIQKLGAAEAINYHEADFSQALQAACPEGVDVYFDNVGGEISDAVYPLLNKFARVVQCGAISSYNKPHDQGPRHQKHLLASSAIMKGFAVHDYRDRFPEGLQFLTKWLNEDKLTYEETIIEGFEQIPDALFGLFRGTNIGKQLVRVAKPGQEKE
ncbi:NADP-dependent oxidoreductase [Bacillus xiapuensis]|uniref:NADP-dependent oxidoreductase n=1 Tax=Bacillus xiapuensis TaxID=2014075 RepID=UPI0038BCADFC